MTRNTVTDPGAKATTEAAMCASWLRGERDRRAAGALAASADIGRSLGFLQCVGKELRARV